MNTDNSSTIRLYISIWIISSRGSCNNMWEMQEVLCYTCVSAYIRGYICNKNLVANKIQNLHYTVQRTYTAMYHTQGSFGGVTKTTVNGLIRTNLRVQYWH